MPFLGGDMKRVSYQVLLVAVFGIALSACSPEVGSEAWCEAMDEKPKGDWSMNEAAEYAKSCVLRQKGN